MPTRKKPLVDAQQIEAALNRAEGSVAKWAMPEHEQSPRAILTALSAHQPATYTSAHDILTS